MPEAPLQALPPPSKAFSWSTKSAPAPSDAGGKGRHGLTHQPKQHRTSFTQLIRNAVLAARNDAAPQTVGLSGRVYRGLAWGFMSVEHPLRKAFIRVVEWRPK